MLDVMTVEEVAARYRVTRWTIYKLVKAGQLPSHRVGNQLRFYADELERHIRENRAIKVPRPAGVT